MQLEVFVARYFRLHVNASESTNEDRIISFSAPAKLCAVQTTYQITLKQCNILLNLFSAYQNRMKQFKLIEGLVADLFDVDIEIRIFCPSVSRVVINFRPVITVSLP